LKCRRNGKSVGGWQFELHNKTFKMFLSQRRRSLLPTCGGVRKSRLAEDFLVGGFIGDATTPIQEGEGNGSKPLQITPQ
jgi:hypothetical protein